MQQAEATAEAKHFQLSGLRICPLGGVPFGRQRKSLRRPEGFPMLPGLGFPQRNRGVASPALGQWRQFSLLFRALSLQLGPRWLGWRNPTAKEWTLWCPRCGSRLDLGRAAHAGNRSAGLLARAHSARCGLFRCSEVISVALVFL